MNNTINISTQNLSINSAKRCVAGNNAGYFQIVSFYVASTSGNRPDSTGLTIKFDPRLTVLGTENGYVFSSKVYNNQGILVTGRGRGATQKYLGPNLYFATTAAGETYPENGYLYFARVQFPPDTKVGDVFTITVELEDEKGNPYEFLFVDSTASKEDREAMNQWTKENGISNGSFTIIE